MTGEPPVHASTVAIRRRGEWAGVAILGPSGAGKSDLALRLIGRGWRLVSDDYTELAESAGHLIASAPATIAGQIEVRGVGIVAMPAASPCPVALLVRAGTPERMPEPATCAMAGVAVPVIVLPLLESSAPIKVELSLRNLKQTPA